MNYSENIREQIRARAEAALLAAPSTGYRSLGKKPTVLFNALNGGTEHGNFYGPAWKAIRSNPEWTARLGKPHSQKRALPPEHKAAARELDSSNSSDALLMNCFCPPGASSIGAAILGASPATALPTFGWKARISLADGSADETEVDMRLGDTLVEAKLTETTFTSRERAHVQRYTALEKVFSIDDLPSSDDHFRGYQLIRNVLAAEQYGLRLCVLIDWRRPDLLQEWWAVHAAINSVGLRRRCGVVYWQQIAERLPAHQAAFLEERYGL